MFHLVSDDTCGIIEKVSNKIRDEINNIEIDRNNYYCYIDRDICLNFQSKKQDLDGILSKLAKTCMTHGQLYYRKYYYTCCEELGHSFTNSSSCTIERF